MIFIILLLLMMPCGIIFSMCIYTLCKWKNYEIIFPKQKIKYAEVVLFLLAIFILLVPSYFSNEREYISLQFFSDSMRIVLALFMLKNISKKNIYDDVFKLLFGLSCLSFYFIYFGGLISSYSNRELLFFWEWYSLSFVISIVPFLFVFIAREFRMIIVCILIIFSSIINTYIASNSLIIKERNVSYVEK